MSKYRVIVSKDVIQYTTFVVDAESEEEAINNYDEGDIEDVDYEPSGDEYVESTELI